MRGNLFTIGEIAKAMGMTVKALRFYERIGLIAPHFTDPTTRYRYFSSEQLMRLDLIKAARSMGVSLKDLASILREKDSRTLIESLERQEERVARKMEELQRTAESIGAAKTAIADSLSSAAERGVYLRDIPERRIVSMKISGRANIEEVSLAYSTLGRIIAERRLLNRYETGILLAPDKRRRFLPSEVFNSVGTVADSDSCGLSTLPRGTFICVRYDEKSAIVQQAKLRAYLRRGKIEPVLMLQADTLSDLLSPEAAQVELQVLVSGGRTCSREATLEGCGVRARPCRRR